MASVNEPNLNLDRTVRIFDKFYEYEQQVPVAEFDVVFAYLNSIFKDKTAALNFTTQVFRVASLSNQTATTILNELKTVDSTEIALTSALAYYLNAYRSKATLLGINASLTSNKFVSRNIYP